MRKNYTKLLVGLLFVLGSVEANAQNVTVNPGAGSYATLKAAFDAINTGIHTGVITVAIVGNTTETVAAVLNASGSGAASYTSITISPSGGAARTITGALATPLVDLNGADNVTIDGLNTGGNSLTISNTNTGTTSGTCTIRFILDAQSNTITRCSILGSATMTTATNGGTIFFSTFNTGGTGNDNNTISSCDIGPATATLPSKAIYGNGTTTTVANYNSGIIITGNNIFDFFLPASQSNGILMSGGNTDWTISNNKFYQTGTRTQTTGAVHAPIQIGSANVNNCSISGNTIGYSSNTGTGTYTFVGISASSRFYPIYLSTHGTITASSIQGNTVTAISVTGAVSGVSTSAPFAGILVASGLANIGNTTGNTIGSTTVAGVISLNSSSGITTSDVYGIYFFPSAAVNISNNMVGGFTVTHTTTGHIDFYGLRANTSSGSTNTFTNNTVGYSAAPITNSAISASSNTYGIYLQAGVAVVTGNTVRNMSMAGANVGTGATSAMIGLWIDNTSATIGNNVSQNTIHTLSSTDATNPVWVTGLHYNGSITGTHSVARNLVYSISVSSSSATSTINGIYVQAGAATYQNNMIAVGAGVANAVQANGINEAGGTDNFYHNSVYVGGAPTAGTGNSFAFNSVVTTNTRSFRDNIFVNARSNSGASGKNYIVRVGGTAPNPAGLTINNNVYYATGGGAVFGLFNSLDVADLPTWKTSVGQDAGSIYGDPAYNDPTNATPDLHIHPTNSSVAEGNGADVGVIDDYDGQTRASFTPVDIGADAGNFTGADVVAPAISYAPFNNTSCLTDRTLSPVTITDPSGVNIAPGTRPRLYYKKSGDLNTFNDNTNATDGWKYVEATGVGGSPFSFTTNYSLLFTGAPTAGQTIQYFVVAQDNAGTPNVGINTGVFATAPSSVALVAANFPVTGTGSFTIVTGLNGTVTIGAAGTYQSLTIAGGLFDAINTNGMTGNVIANILDASVAETGAIALNAINYNGCAAGPHTLTIKPNTTSTLTGAVGTGSLVKLNGADNVTIDGSNSGGSDRSLTIQNSTATTSGNAVIWMASPALGNGSTNNTIKNCIIEGNSSTTTFLGVYIGGNATISVTAAGTELNSNNTINNNLFRKTQYGLALFGYAAASPDQNNSITNNNFGTAVAGEGFNLAAINADRQQNLVVSGNDVQNVTHSGTTTNVFGIRLLDFKNGQAYNNKVHDLAYTGTSTTKLYGIAVTSTTYTTVGNPSNGLIYNNIVYKINSTSTSSGVWTTTGILASAGYGDRFYYNSVHLTGQLSNSGSTLAAAFANGDNNITSVCTNIDVRNNIFSITGSNTGAAGNFYAHYTKATTLTGSTLNYNDLYCNGTGGVTNNVGLYNSVAYTTLGTWQGATGMDANSIAADPLYNSTTNLVPQLGSPVIGAANNAGTGVTTDILGAARSSGTPPTGSTMGAYEGAGDVAGPTITYTALGNTCATSSRTLTASISDPSGVPTAGIGLPRLYWRINAGAWMSATGTYISGNNYDFTFGSGVVAGNTVQYYIVAQDNFSTPNVSAFPAAGAGGFTINPPAASTAPTTPSSYDIQTTLAGGTYTVGAAGTYTTLTAAVAAYNTSCLTGPVVFELLDASYTTGTGETFPITINANGDASSTNTFTIRPATGVTASVSGTSGAALIRLNGAKYVTFDGLNTGGASLAVENTSVSAGTAVFWLSSNGVGLGASNNTIRNCSIKAGIIQNTSSSTTYGIVIAGSTLSSSTTSVTAGDDNDNNTIMGNSFTRVRYGVYTRGGATTNANTGTVISNNTFGPSAFGADEIGKAGILIREEDGIQITGNTIQFVGGDYANTTTGSDRAGIVMSTDATWSGSSAPTSVYVKNALIARNSIHDIVEEKTFSAAGIVIAGADGANATNNVVANNMLFNIKANGTGGDQAVGIGASAGNGDKLVFNSFYSTGDTDPNATATMPNTSNFGINISTTSVTNPVVKNNIVYMDLSSSSAPALKNADINIPAAFAWGTGGSDHNDLYILPANTQSNIGCVGGSGGTFYATLATWQAAVTQDANSRGIQPNFTSATDLHLLATTNCGLDGYGTPIAGITTDYDNAARDATTPDIGADEFTATYSGTLAGVAGSATCENKTVSVAGTNYATNACNLITRVLPSGGSPVSGKVNVCVTLDATQQYYNGAPYVQRHMDIEPATNAATATGTVTLYFTDAEFVAYNTNNPVYPPLPTAAGGGSADPNRANLKINQYHGTPTTTPSVPGSYTGGSAVIIPNVANITWNGSYWSVTFDVNGFSGFYAYTGFGAGPLPITINYFTGAKQNGNHLLNWKVTCHSTPRATMILERSADSRNFSGINTITADAARCNQPFDHTDTDPLKGMNYYRLKMMDVDGKISYSGIVALLNAVKGFDIISIAPNPVTQGNFKLQVASAQASKMDLTIIDMQGRLVSRKEVTVIAGSNNIPVDVSSLSAGTYTIYGTVADDSSRIIRFVKQ